MALKLTPGGLPLMPIFFSSAYSQSVEYGKEATKNGYFKPADVNCLSISYETDRELLEACIPSCYTLLPGIRRMGRKVHENAVRYEQSTR